MPFSAAIYAPLCCHFAARALRQRYATPCLYFRDDADAMPLIIYAADDAHFHMLMMLMLIFPRFHFRLVAILRRPQLAFLQRHIRSLLPPYADIDFMSLCCLR